MDRRKFLKMLGLGSLIPFVKTEEPEAMRTIIGNREPSPPIKGEISWMWTLIPISSRPYAFQCGDVYDFRICPGDAEVIAIYRNSKLVDSKEYEQFSRWEDGYHTCVRFRKEQIDFHNKPYELFAEVKYV